MTSIELGEDYPLVCEKCLGSEGYVRMTKVTHGVECKISKRPATLFEWRANGVKRATCVSYEVAAQKNICQVCMTDLTFGLPVGVRDTFLRTALEKGIEGISQQFATQPKSRVGQDYLLNRQLALKHAAAGDQLQLENGQDASDQAVTSLVLGAQAHLESGNHQGQFRLPEVCDKWLKNAGKRCLAGCPKRPCCGAIKFPELTQTAIRDKLEEDLRHGRQVDTLLGFEILRKLMNTDAAIKSKKTSSGHQFTLYVSNLPKGSTEQQVRDAFSRFQGLTKVRVTEGNNPVGFVEFNSQANAEVVLSLSFIQMGVGARCPLAWAKSSEPPVTTSPHKKKARVVEEEIEKKPATPPPAVLNALALRKSKGLDVDL
ncbi:hypothetical protein BASA81_000822 [Batrachochytrium salamandrivorans]|nr:hypothetical protein BASA81_000822 [Batrachochytrium salamandrivorans]